jgi:hypothetical protein
VVLGDLKLQLRHASHVVVVLGASAHHRARAPAKRGRRKGGVRDNIDAIIIKWLACQIQRPRATEEWLNRHGVLCQELGIPEWDVTPICGITLCVVKEPDVFFF